MRKLHQMEIPDPLVSEGEYIEYTANNGMVFHVLAVENNYASCHGCVFHRFKNERSAVGNPHHICDCGPHGESSLCHKGPSIDLSRKYCKFIDIDKILEDL